MFVESGLSDRYRGFATAYLAARAVSMLEWARSGLHIPEFRPIAMRFLGR